MFRPRIIPVVLIGEDGHATKTIRFSRRIDLGDPVNTVSLFNAFRVDELVLLDIDASRRGRTIHKALLQDIASEAEMPFSVGGGIRSLEDIRQILMMGAEKVVLSTVASENPPFVSKAAETFGSSSITVCIDVKKGFFGRRFIHVASSRKNTQRSAIDQARLMEEMGAGELLLQSVDCDGMMTGYDIDLLREVAAAVTVPVIALGGAGCIEDMISAYADTYVSALAAGSLFVFQGRERGVLVNYPDHSQLRRFQHARRRG